MKKSRLNLFLILWAVLSIFLVVIILFFVLKIDESNKSIEQLQKSIEELYQNKPQDGADGRTPTYSELLALVTPLIPNPVPGSNGVNGTDGANGNDGVDGTNAEPCTTYTDENNDSYIACPDGTQTLILQPDQPRQIELCSSPTMPFGWRYVGTLNCQEVRGS